MFQQKGAEKPERRKVAIIANSFNLCVWIKEAAKSLPDPRFYQTQKHNCTGNCGNKLPGLNYVQI